MSHNIVHFPVSRSRPQRRNRATSRHPKSGEDARRKWRQIANRLEQKRPPRSKTQGESAWRVPKDDPDCGNDIITLSRNFYDIITRYANDDNSVSLSDLARVVSPNTESTRPLERLRLSPKNISNSKQSARLNRRIEPRLRILDRIAQLTNQDAYELRVTLFHNTWFELGDSSPSLEDALSVAYHTLANEIGSVVKVIADRHDLRRYFAICQRYGTLPDPRTDASFFTGYALTGSYELDLSGAQSDLPLSIAPRCTVYSYGDEDVASSYRVLVAVHKLSLDEHYSSFIQSVLEEEWDSSLKGTTGSFQAWLYGLAIDARNDGPRDSRNLAAQYLVYDVALSFANELDICILPDDTNEPRAYVAARRRAIVESASLLETPCMDTSSTEPVQFGPRESDFCDQAHNGLTTLNGIGGPASDPLRFYQQWTEWPSLFHPDVPGVPLIPFNRKIYPGFIIEPDEAGAFLAGNVDWTDHYIGAEEVWDSVHFGEYTRVYECNGQALERYLSVDLADPLEIGNGSVLYEAPPGGRTYEVSPTAFPPNTAAAYLEANHLEARTGLRWFDYLERDIEYRRQALEDFLARRDVYIHNAYAKRRKELKEEYPDNEG